MSARVLNPISMTEVGRGGLGRVVPTKAELAPIRRDLFGPVDHAANRALVERELRSQSIQDAERWGFDFQLGVPRCDARYAWELVEPTDVVPEPYALRGMPYLRKHAPATPRKANKTARKTATAIVLEEAKRVTIIDKEIVDEVKRNAEMTPPQELRVPEICTSDDDGTDNQNQDQDDGENQDKEDNEGNKIGDPTTPILPISARKQLAITDFMKSRKRTLKGSSKSMLEPPEKINRNTGKIRS